MTAVRTCQYAACSTFAIYDSDGWWFCWQHYREHLAVMHDSPWPSLKSVDSLIQQLCRQPCGTEAALRRHQRNGETCELCDVGALVRRNPNGGAVRLRGHQRQEAS